MMQCQRNETIRARWILPVESEPIRDGAIVIRNGRIVEIGKAARITGARDLGDVLLMPALVNAHTHLELSDLPAPLGKPGMPFTDWIKLVIGWRRERGAASIAEQITPKAISAGLAEGYRTGTATFGDITIELPNAVSDTGWPKYGITFYELIAFAAERTRPVIDRGQSLLAAHRDSKLSTMAGLSPHAPYSVHPDLLSAAARFSAEQRFPIAMHLAETESELELLRTGSGPFLELLQELNAWDPATIARNSTPFDYLKLLAQADRCLVVHGNYLAGTEIAYIGEHRSKMTVIYCPRTHNYFRHPPYPLTKMLAAGVRTAIGTDSRASNPNLNMLDELRFAATSHPTISPDQWLRMATLFGAEALGLDADLGSLRPGKLASVVAIKLEEDLLSDPWRWFEDERAQVTDVILP